MAQKFYIIGEKLSADGKSIDGVEFGPEVATSLPPIIPPAFPDYFSEFLMGVPNAIIFSPEDTPIATEILCFPAADLNRQQMGSGFVTSHYRIYTTAKLAVGDRVRITDGFQGDVEWEMYVKSAESGIDIETNQEAFRIYICA